MDISEFKHRKQHNGFELEKVFNIQAEYSTSKEQKTLAVVSKKFFSTLRRKLLKINLKTNGTIINEEAIGHFYHPDLMLSENSYFIGCWQTENYFIQISAWFRDVDIRDIIPCYWVKIDVD